MPLPVQGQPGPSHTKGSRPLRTCHYNRYAGLEQGWAGVGRGVAGCNQGGAGGPKTHTTAPQTSPLFNTGHPALC